MTQGAARRSDPAAEVLLALAVASGEPGDAGRLRHRLGMRDPAWLADAALPITARRRAVRDPDVPVRRAVARNPRATPADLAALLERPDPVVDRLVYRHATALPWMRREILAPGRHPDAIALAVLWEEIRACTEDPPDHPHFVGAAVVSGIPALIEHALRTQGPRLTRAEQLRGLLGLFAEPERLGALLGEVRFRPGVPPEPGSAPGPGVADLAAAALASGDDGPLRAAVLAAEGSAGLIAGLRAGEPEPTWRRHVDWTGLPAAHRADPLPESAAVALAARPDCPEVLLAELYRAHPAAVARVARPSVALLEAAVHLPGHVEATRIAAAAAASGLADERHAAPIPSRVAPARVGVAMLAELPPDRPLAELIHRHLGCSADRWATLRGALSRYRGTLADLLAGIADGTVPGPGSAPPPALSRPYRFLLHAAPAEDLRALLPHLPDELLRDLLGRGPLPEHVFDTALAGRDPRVCAALAANSGLDPRRLGRLVGLDEPRVNAAVYRNPHCPLTLRRRIASGAPRTTGRTEPVPLDPALRAELLDCSDQRRLTPLVVSGDPELVHAALYAFPSADARAFAFLKVWRRGGPDAARRLVELIGGLGPHRADALPDHLESAAGPGRLGAVRIPYEDPDALPNVLAGARGRNATRRLLATLVHEPYAYDLPRLIARHRETPFAPESIDELLRHEDAVGEPARLLRLAVVNRACGTTAEDLNREPIDRLREVAFHRTDAGWVNDCVEHELLDPIRLVDTARPAGEVLRALPKLTRGTVAAPVRARIGALVRTRLAGHVEASVIALSLLDSFAGTVGELIDVAAQAAGPPPGPGQRAADDAEIAESARELATSPPASRTPERVGPTLPTRCGRRGAPDRGCALAAAHLLRSMVPGAPIPTDPAVLTVFAETPEADVPGLAHPDWLRAACAAAPVDLPRERLARRDPVGFRAGASASVRYRAGLVGPAELIAGTPARALSAARPGEFSQLAREPLTRAVRALLAEHLGHDPRRWLAALAVMDSDGSELPLPKLLERVAAGAPEPPGDGPPAVLSDAGSALLVYADVRVLRAVLPLLAPGAPSILARDAERGRHVTADLVEYVLGLTDVEPALILAEGEARSSHTRHVRERLLARRDPALDDRLYGDVKRRGDVAERRRILARAADDPRPLSAALRARLLEPGVFSAYWVDALRVTVEAADADVVEPALAAMSGKLSLLDQLLAAHNVLRFGGAHRLRAVIDRGLLGSGAAGIAGKALEAHDRALDAPPAGGRAGLDVFPPARAALDAGLAVLSERVERESSPARLVARLRGCRRLPDAERVLDRPYRRDWALLAREHAREPWPAGVRHALATRPDAPDEIVLSMLADLHPAEAFAAARRGPRTARAVTALVVPDGGTAEWHAEVERLVEAGLLTGHDLVHEVGHAERALRYLADARTRVDLAGPVRAAVDAAYVEVAVLAVDLLGTEDRSWQRLFAALTEHDEHWRRAHGPAAGIAGLLTYAAREPLARVFEPPPSSTTPGTAPRRPGETGE
ncbi:hypothetical protein [Embleya sp. NPDC059237]|uniref:hypothetical protein n=1 Tax=Embleya sp. NPDC059237 TaxID=3346784 RepID=UPI0036CC490A